VVSGQSGAAEQAFEGHIAERIDAEKVADLFECSVVGDKLFLGGEIYAVKTGETNGRTTDPHMNFFRPGVAEGPDFAFGGGAADNGVVDDNDSFAVYDFPDGGELDFDGQLA